MSKVLLKSHIFPLLAIVGAIAFTAISFYYITFFHVSPLSRDQWHMYAPYFEGGLLHAALTPMSTHRHLFPFLIFDMDMSLFGGRNHFLILFGSIFNAFIIFLLITSVTRDSLLSQIEKLAFCILIITSMTWLINIAQLGWGFMSTQYYLAIFAYLFSIYSAYSYCHSPDANFSWLLASIVCGAIATFSFGMGILVWPALLYFLYLWRAQARYITLVVLSCVFCLAVFLFLPGGKTIEDAVIFSPRSTVTFLFQLAGGPVYYFLKSYRFIETETIKSLAELISVIVTSAGILLLLRQLMLRRSLSLFASLCCALMLVGLGTAALISFTRQPFFLDVWVDRYQLWATLFWLGFLPLCYMELAAAPLLKTAPGNTYIKKLFLGCLLAFPILALPSQLDMGARLSEYKNRVQESLLVYQTGIPDKHSAEEALHWNWENKLPPFFSVLNYLRLQKKNIYYHDYSDVLGHNIDTLNIKNYEALTSLHINKVEPIQKTDLLDLKLIKNADHFSAFTPSAHSDIFAYQIEASVITTQPWTQVIVANQAGVVIGLGIYIKQSMLPRSHLKYIHADYNLFAVLRNDDIEKVRFYFLNEGDKSFALISDELRITP